MERVDPKFALGMKTRNKKEKKKKMLSERAWALPMFSCHGCAGSGSARGGWPQLPS